MQIAATGAALSAMPMFRTPEAKESPGPDHDRDADDATGGKQIASVSSGSPTGPGNLINLLA